MTRNSLGSDLPRSSWLVPVAIVGGIALAIVGGAVTYGHLFATAEERATWNVASHSGGTEVSVGGGAWKVVEMRMTLTDGDRVRTSADGELTLIHADSQVEVRTETQLEISKLNDDASKFNLTQGQVFVEARNDRVSMVTPGDIRADATDAGFGVTVRDDGWTQLQVKRGNADLTSAGTTEHVEAGEVSVATIGRPPTTPEAIPEALLLNVRFPDAETFNARLATVEGIADPGTRVKIAGRAVQVALDGTWSTEIELAEGVNQIEVSGVDAVGNTRTERSQPIRVDTRAPGLEGATIGSRSSRSTPTADAPSSSPASPRSSRTTLR